MKINKLFIIFSAFFISAAVFAQGRQMGKALQSIRAGVTHVHLKIPSVSSRVPAATPAQFQRRYKEALLGIQNAAKRATAPIELSAPKKPVVVIGEPRISVLAKRKLALAQAQQQADQALYDWGESLAQTGQLGYQTAPRATAAEKGTVVLTINGKSAFIRRTPAKTGETVITPEEISVNANVLNTVVPAFKDWFLTVWQDTPEKAAGFFYLQRNFKESLEEFNAAAEAFHALPSGKLEWLTGPSAKALLVRQNYNYAAANLAVSSAELLKFMSLHPDVYSGPLESYRTIMQLNNQNSSTPDVFQSFWNNRFTI